MKSSLLARRRLVAERGGDMADRQGTSSRVIGALADLTGRSEAEATIMVGVAMAAAAAAVAIRTVKLVVDLGMADEALG